MSLHSDIVNESNSSGLTALHIAAGLGMYDMIELLLQHGARINAAPVGGYTPFSHALNSVSKGIGATQQTLDLLTMKGAELREKSVVKLHVVRLLSERARELEQEKVQGGRSRKRSSKTKSKRRT